MAVQVAFALACFAIAAWLAPRWRRMRARRASGGAYWFVTLNVFGGAVLGVALLWQPAHRAFAEYRDWRNERYLKTLAIRCDRTSIEIRNDGAVSRRLTVDDVALESGVVLLEDPQRWYVTAQPHATDLAPGESAHFALSELEKGPCAASGAFVVDMGLSPGSRCDRAVFHVTSAESGRAPELDAKVTCTFGAR